MLTVKNKQKISIKILPAVFVVAGIVAIAAAGFLLMNPGKKSRLSVAPPSIPVEKEVVNTKDGSVSTSTVGGAIKDTGPEFEPGTALVKFSSDAVIGELLEKTHRADGIVSTTDTKIQEVFTRYEVTAAERVFAASTDAEARRVVKVNHKVNNEERTRQQTLALIDELRSTPGVVYAEPNYIFRTTQDDVTGGEDTTSFAPNDPFFWSTGTWGQSYRDLWGTVLIDAQTAWDTSRGTGVIVAVIDTGVDYTHEDIAANMTSGWDFVNNDSDPMDDNGHGTHVAGTIAAVMNNSRGIAGIAPQSRIMPVKGLNNYGSGTNATLAAAIDYAVSNGAKVINASWGMSDPSAPPQTMYDAIVRAYNADVLFVAAAGNSNGDVGTPAYGNSPANFLEVMTIAAIDSARNKASFSNYGAKIDVTAPGVDILSLRAAGTDMYCQQDSTYCQPANRKIVPPCSDPSPNLSACPDNRYYRSNGTSMAAPHVAGVAALFRSLGTFSVEQTRQAIRHAAADLGSSGFDTTFGYGQVHAAQAVLDTQPLAVHLTAPYGTLIGQASVTIRGIADGANLSSWRIERGQGSLPSSWTQIASGTTRQPALAQPWTINVPDGQYTLRLTATTNGGVTYEDRLPVVIDNVVVTWPTPVPARSAQPINILGTVAPYGMTSYSVALTKTDGTPVAVPITLPNGGQEPIRDGIIATMDARSVALGWYRLVVTATTSNGPIVDTTTTALDPTLHPGWPVNILPIWMPVDHLTAGDLNGDGASELFIADKNRLLVYQSDGSKLWEAAISPSTFMQMGPVVGDVTGDGQPEVIASDFNGYLYVWNASGSPVPGWPKNIGGTTNHLALDDIDGDGLNEIITGNWLGQLSVYSGVTGLRRWAYSAGVGMIHTPSVADIIPSMPGKEIVITGQTSSLLLVSSQGTLICRNDLVPAFAGFNKVVIGDVDNNGDLEMVYAEAYGNIPMSYGIIHVFNEDCVSESAGWPKTLAHPLNTPAIGDISGDGLNEVVAGTDAFGWPRVAADLYAWSGNGDLLPGWPVQSRNEMDWDSSGYAPPVLADIDGDGIADVISSLDVSTAALRAYRYTGQMIAQFPKPTTRHVFNPTITPAVSDLDGDGLLEIAWIDSNYYIYVWDTPSPANGPRPWPMFQHDVRHTGALTSTLTPPSVTITSPTSGSLLRGTVQLQAVTTPSPVDRVEFYDSTTLLGTDITAPYAYDWNTQTASDGSHSLTAKAYSGADVGTSSAVSVTVDNTPPTVPPHLWTGRLRFASAEPSPSTVNGVTVAGVQIALNEVAPPDDGGGGFRAKIIPLLWDPSSDATSGLAGYRIHWCMGAANCTTTSMKDLASTATTYDFVLTIPGTYNLEVSAYDYAGNESGRSNRRTLSIW